MKWWKEGLYISVDPVKSDLVVRFLMRGDRRSV